MNKVLLMSAIMVIVALTLIGCAQNEEAKPKTEETTTSATEETTAPARERTVVEYTVEETLPATGGSGATG